MQTLFSALIFMTGTGGSIYGIELYLSVCVVIMGLSCTLVFVWYLWHGV
jgi:hypothetical protein